MSYFPKRGNEGYRVLHYDLTLDYRAAANRLSGTAVLAAVATAPLKGFALDLGPFRVDRVQVNGARARFTHRDDKLRVTPPGWLAEGRPFSVEVRYQGSPRPVPSPWGELGWEQLADGVIVASQPTGASSWFPCNDRPSEKATYRFAVTAASPYQVVANGARVSSVRGASATTWVYEQGEPMAAYLASVQIGRYVSVDLDGVVPQRVYHPARLGPRIRHDFGRQDRMMAVFADLFGPYPFGAYTVVVTDDELEIPVEAQGMSIFGANHVDGRRGSERLVAHELAHQWFGNSLTLGHWRDIWLHEGFAAYAEWLWSEASGGEPAAAHARRWHRRLTAAPQDFVLADPGSRRIFDDRVYKRGALTLHALRRTLGDVPFFSMLREWTAAHRHGVVTTGMFTDLARHFTPEPLEGLFASWLYAPRLPGLP
ncbi:putative peptidase M1, membrane alanine aminopeptidase [Acrocarpospora phusangensis]|uniref:Aminopeptidase N n=1 Tax=Acrocarpospora phusangensis TaxID=1070424 RepID=A0A919URJ7_9ACTN|nr:M1 family metallopeptidase [Acrocarpospora phusangensis]GIH28112.1 putative peptidase M1, membrane alanine aminopeptidase [Acrocarpospora phusangensis]